MVKNIAKILENLPNSKEVIVEFTSGNSFALSGFEMVDETIYQRIDVYTCNIISIIVDIKSVFSVDNVLEFDLDEVTEIKDSESGAILYELT